MGNPQIISFHKINDIDDFQFDNECPDNDNPNVAFAVWADGLFNPSDFDGVNLIKLSDYVERVRALRNRINTKYDGMNTEVIELINEYLPLPKTTPSKG